MKKIIHFLLVFFLFSLTHTFAQELKKDSLQFLWAETLEVSPQVFNNNGVPYLRTFSKSLKVNSEGELFFMCAFRTLNGESLKYQNSSLKGVDHDTPAGSPNFAFYKTNKEGKLLWTLNSSFGNFEMNLSQFTPTNDGGALIALKARHLETYRGDTMAIIAGLKDTVVFRFQKPHRIIRRPILLKVSRDGRIEWHRMEYTYDKDKPLTKISATQANAFSFWSAVTDEEGNVYLAGDLKDTIYWTTPQLTQKIIKPHADKQDLFVLKLDANGRYISHLTTEGDSLGDISARSIIYDNKKLYLYGHVSGDNQERTISLADKSIQVLKKNHLILARISPDLDAVDWLKQIKCAYPSHKSDLRLNPTKISVANNKILAMGRFYGGIVLNENDTLKYSYETDPANTDKMKMYVLKLDATTGEIEAAVSDHKSDAFKSMATDAFFINNKIYAFGHDLGTNCFMYVYDKDLNFLADYDLIKGGITTLTREVAYKGDELYLMARSDQKKKTLVYGNPEDIQLSTTSGVLAAFKLPASSTGLPQFLKANDAGFVVYSAKGKIIFDVEKTTPITIYNISGQMLMQFLGLPGKTVKTLAPGVYIVNRQKVIVL